MPPIRAYAEEKIKLIAQGDIEQIDGRRLALGDIMTSGKKVVLINGAPGVGKTRLAFQLRREWANRQLLTSFHLVLYIPLRDPNTRLSESIDELLNYFNENCNDSDRKLIKKDQGRGVLFILDGWDELRLSCREEHQLFPRLISGHILPGCCVIVTSRPGSSFDIACHADQVIEILGFTQTQVKEYIQSYFCEDEQGALKLVDDLESYPNIASTCYIAINLAIVCYVYHVLGFKLPQTLTEVYQWFIIHTILRHLNRKRVLEDIRADLPPVDNIEDFFSANDFHESVEKTFKESIKETLHCLGELALNGLQNGDHCFTRKVLVETCKIDESDFQFDGFGLLKPMQISLSTRSEPYYHFLHLSIQEFVAAMHVSKMEASNAIKWLVHDKKYDAIIKFFCGLDQFKSQALRIFLKTAPKLLMFHLECTYEGQWKDYCVEIAKRCSRSFKLVDQNLQPQQWEVLAYVMANSMTQWHFEYSQSFLEARELTGFSRHLSNNRMALSHLRLDRAHIGHQAYVHLARICQTQVALIELDLNDCSMNDDGLLTIISALEHHPSLEILQIRDDAVTIAVVDALLKLLPYLPALKYIQLSLRSFSYREYQTIIRCASKCSPPPHVLTPEDPINFTTSVLSGNGQSKTNVGGNSYCGLFAAASASPTVATGQGGASGADSQVTAATPKPVGSHAHTICSTSTGMDITIIAC